MLQQVNTITALAIILLLSLTSAVAQDLEIWEIQGTGNESPYLGQLVSTRSNVVTAVGESFFVMQTPTDRTDSDPLTSNGLFVYTDEMPNLRPGQVVNVSGVVREFAGLTELAGFELRYQATGETLPLPDPVNFTSTFPSTQYRLVHDLERVENMRVTFEAQVVGPTTSSASIAALRVGDERPFREPGIKAPGQTGVPEWDGNPELFWIDPNAIGAPNNRFLGTGMSVSGAGVLYQEDDQYIVFPDAYSVSGDGKEFDVRTPTEAEITVASLNMLQLVSDSDNLSTQYPKLARYIVDRLKSPDILAVQEVENETLLSAVTERILALDPTVDYRIYLTPSSGDLNVAYLVRTTIDVVSIEQLGMEERLSSGGRLHDRPPLLLTADLPTNPVTRIQVLNLHIRSLIGIGDISSGSFVRRKRHEQAVSIARMVQARQNDGNLIVVGDYNAFPFSDGYVDVYAQISGKETIGALQTLADIVSPSLIDQAQLHLPAAEQYSFVFNGSVQQIDHCLTNALPDFRNTDFAFARGNADGAFPYYFNANLTIRSSDHDGFVLYLEPSAPLTNTSIVKEYPLQLQLANPYTEGSPVYWYSAEVPSLNVQLWTSVGQLVQQWQLEPGMPLPKVPGGVYTLSWQSDTQSGSQKVVIP